MDWLTLIITAVLLICRRASAQRARKIELREPRKEPLLREEEIHKYIHDGKEYNRAPNLFDVGGELKLLPEVLSDLNFEPRDFVDGGTPAQQKDLRDSRPWGRLYVDGWPSPTQYMRSHFGGPAPNSMQRMVLADPLDACKPLQEKNITESTMVIAVRGECTFATKARNAQRVGASSFLIVNNEPGLVHPPGPDGKDLDIFSAMIPQAEGSVLMDVMKSGEEIQGILVPMNCYGNSGLEGRNQLCHPAVKTDRELIKRLPMGGFVGLPDGQRFEYLLAEFGAKVPSRQLLLALVDPPDACTTPTESRTATSVEAVLASRGGCSFIDKAEVMMAAGSTAALIIVNNETSLFHPGASPRWRGANISFPTLIVTDLAGHALSALPSGSQIMLTASSNVTAEDWDEIRRLRDPSGWPRLTDERQSLYETLISRSAGFVDRLSALSDSSELIRQDFDGEQAPMEELGEEKGIKVSAAQMEEVTDL